MPLGRDKQVYVSDIVDMTDVVAQQFHSPSLVKVHRVGFIVVTATTGAMTMTFSHTKIAVTAGGGALGGGGEPAVTVTVPTLAPAGAVYYRDAVDFPTITGLGHGAPQVYIPGESVTIISDGVPTVGTGHAFIEFEVASATNVKFKRSAPGREVTVPLDTTVFANLIEVFPA
jgi:hypothetical protein